MGARRPRGLHEFVDRGAHVAGILRTHVAHHHAIGARDHRPERGQFAHLRVAAGHVFQSGRQAEGTGAQVGVEHRLQPLQLRVRRPARAVVDAGAAAQRAVAGQRRDVEARRRGLDRVHPGREAARVARSARQRGAAAILAQHHRGHAHREERRERHLQRVAVGVQVDEARRQHATTTLDHAQPARVAGAQPTDARDGVAVHQHVGASRGRAAAVDQAHVTQQHARASRRRPPRAGHTRQRHAGGPCRHRRQHLAPGPRPLPHRAASPVDRSPP